MIRTQWSWCIFLFFVLLSSVAMAWMTWTTLKLERQEATATRQAENERLALWRMDSALVPVISLESTRPYFAYSAFYSADNVFSKMFAPIGKGEIQVPSSLLTHESEFVSLHFQVDRRGKLTSPQVPTGNMRDLAESRYTTHERIEACSIMLQELETDMSIKAMWTTLDELGPPQENSNWLAQSENDNQTEELAGNSLSAFPPEPPFPDDLENTVVQRGRTPFENETPQQATPSPQSLEFNFLQQQQRTETQRQQRNDYEYQRRAYAAYQTSNSPATQSVIKDKSSSDETSQQPMHAMWNGGKLVLARKVIIDGEEFVQGCLFNWPAIQDWMTDEIADLLPEARLTPLLNENVPDNSLRLASLPALLIPGHAIAQPVPMLSPIRFSLLIAWFGLLLGAIAVGWLLAATMRLSERRAAFVSAVTHELRTPLTTFKLYTEMLVDGMVPDEKKRGEYLSTLRSEADRLGHLIENVLSYSRLEKNSSAVAKEPVALNDLVQRFEDPLSRRAEHSGMNLQVRCAENHVDVLADSAAIERIVFNLVDNACKYAVGADDRTITVETTAHDGESLIRVCDNGPGFPEAVKRKLFRPFSKSAVEAAHSAPGVGLGLALCRRLARNMGGDLSVDWTVTQGACVVLSLPQTEKTT